MAPPASANSPPPKPWEQSGSASGPTPFKPPSAGNTSDVVESSGTANPGEIVSTSDRSGTGNRNAHGRPLPTRPWEQTYGSNSYGGHGSSLNYNSGLGSGMYGPYGGLGGGLYGGGIFYQVISRFFLMQMHGVVSFFGRVTILIDQNTQAFHFFMTALLQLFDRTGLLYGELARFVLRLLGIRRKPKKVHPAGPNRFALPGPNDMHVNQNFIEGPKAVPNESWDNLWGNDARK